VVCVARQIESRLWKEFSVYVCLCNGITDSQIREAAQQGARSVRDLEQCLGVASGCGRCQPYAAELLEEVLPSRRTPVQVQAA
jgi:bacterioferritin-associated ferredoxin